MRERLRLLREPAPRHSPPHQDLGEVVLASRKRQMQITSRLLRHRAEDHAA